MNPRHKGRVQAVPTTRTSGRKAAGRKHRRSARLTCTSRTRDRAGKKKIHSSPPFSLDHTALGRLTCTQRRQEGEGWGGEGGGGESGECETRSLRSTPEPKSSERRLNLSGSWQQGHSAAYSTAFDPSRLQGIYPDGRLELRCNGCVSEPGRAGPMGDRVTVIGMSDPAPSMASTLEAFRC